MKTDRLDRKNSAMSDNETYEPANTELIIFGNSKLQQSILRNYSLFDYFRSPMWADSLICWTG